MLSLLVTAKIKCTLDITKHQELNPVIQGNAVIA